VRQKRRSALRQHIGRFLRPVSKRVPDIRNAAQIISRSPRSGVRLLRDVRTSSQLECQPDVYPFAAYLADKFDCTHIIAVGRPTARNLKQIYPRFEVSGIVGELDLKSYRGRYAFGTWLPRDWESADATLLPENILKRALIVCSGVLEQLDNPVNLLSNLKRWLAHSPACILTLANGTASESRQLELEQLLRAAGLNAQFVGLTSTDNASSRKDTSIAVIANNAANAGGTPAVPADFRVVAFMAAYNEADIIVESIKKWTDQGVAVHVLENWSTDATFDLVKQLETQLPITVERFPQSGPSDFFDWGAMLERIEQLSGEIEADWFVRRGADEVLQSPWPGVSYRDALYLVDQAGFNCVDHTIVEFHPVDEGFEAGMDHEAYFNHFDFKHLSHPFQRKAWKNYGQPISTIPSAGHDVVFAGRRVYPFKFLLKHYSFRSQKHGEKKVFRERKARWNPAERARGWHIHYDAMQEGHQFVRPSSEKESFEESVFNRTYLVERLSGIGVDR
jgi:glycosyltransferase involved in cell wall biosynthesis